MGGGGQVLGARRQVLQGPKDRAFLNYPISAGDFSDFLREIDERLGSPEFRAEMGMPKTLNYITLAGLGKAKLKLKLPIDEEGYIAAKLYRSTLEDGKDEITEPAHLDALAERLRGKMARVIARPKRLWVSCVSYGLQFELVKLEYDTVAAPRTPSEDASDEPEFVD